jgi:hypothetical protein
MTKATIRREQEKVKAVAQASPALALGGWCAAGEGPLPASGLRAGD